MYEQMTLFRPPALPARAVYGSGVGQAPALLGRKDSAHMEAIYLDQILPLEDYDKIIVLFSGGKDSLACVLDLLERGVPREKMELWHHDIDGGHPTRKMDWPVTQNYVRAVAEYLGITLRVSWRVNGFWGEVYRIGASWPIQYIDPPSGETLECPLSEKQLRSARLRERILDDLERAELESMGHRMKFPAKSGSLATRWCSSICKIMVADSVIRNLDLEELKSMGSSQRFPFKGSIANGRFCSPNLKREVGDSVIRNLDLLRQDGQRLELPAKSSCQQGRWCSGSLKAQVESKLYADIDALAQNVKILVVSGERRQESAGRSKYNEMEVHRTNATAKAHRLVHQWRSVIDWGEAEVWDIIRRWRITPHPCYTAGWNRCSCMMCIFSLPSHWAGIRELFPERFAEVEEDERVLGFTLDNKKPLAEYTGNAKSCVCHDNPLALQRLTSGEFSVADVEQQKWTLPAGAFHGASGGPC